MKTNFFSNTIRAALTVALGLGGAIVAPQAAFATNTDTTSCTAIGASFNAVNQTEYFVTLAEGDTITINNTGAFDIELRVGNGAGALVLEVTAGNVGSYTIPAGAGGTYHVSRVDAAVLSCTMGTVEDPQDALMTLGLTEFADLYQDMSRNVSGALNNGAGPVVTNNGFFLQSLGLTQSTQSSRPDWNMWVSGDYDAMNGSAFNGYQADIVLGADYMLDPDTVVGGLFSLGKASYDTSFGGTTGALDNDGYTVGAYFGKRLGSGLIVDGLFAVSDLNYDVSNGAATGSFDATRYGLSMGVYKSTMIGDFMVEPKAKLIVAREKQDGYTDSTATAVAAKSVTNGRLTFGPKVYLKSQNPDILPWISVDAEYDWTTNVTVVTGAPDLDDNLSLRARFGFVHQTDTGALNFDIDAGGLGTGQYSSVGASLVYRLEF